jgi:Fe-Mn family superoxide dismutase
MYDRREFKLEHVEGLSRRAIELHLDLYRGYVEQVNKLLTGIRESPKPVADKATGDARARRLAFEWNGMVLHERFFEALRGPDGAPDKNGVLAEAFDESFGGFDAWRKDLLQMAELRGIGWVAAVRDRETNRLFNTWIDAHHLGMPAGVETIFVLDLWEHAYLIDFEPSRREDYVETVLRNVDWSVVEARCKVPAE